MQISKWIAKARKSVRPKQSSKSPRITQIFVLSVVALIAVAGLVLAAHQSTPPKTVTAVAQPVTTTQATLPSPKTATQKPNAHANASAQTAERATITGCLEQSHDGFRLKDTEGADVPKSRSWKTGFLTKHSASVDLVDTKNRLKLANHVGERVTVSGMLLEHELEGRSISRVANSCD
jgi:hypothetical protein